MIRTSQTLMRLGASTGYYRQIPKKGSELKDSTQMWFGKFRGKRLHSIPLDYLKKTVECGIIHEGLADYIKTRDEI